MKIFMKYLSYFTFFLLILMGGTTLYYQHEIKIAREQTPLLIAQAFQQHQPDIGLTQLSAQRLQMLLAIEDPQFYKHHGVDLTTRGAGMTTLTQGLVKILYYPEGFKQGIAKIRQTLIAQYALDAYTSKDQQLLLFLNLAYFGHAEGQAIRGFSQAAHYYFHKEFSALSDEEFLSLVAMLIGPNHFKPNTAAHTEHMQRIHAYLSGKQQPASVLDVEYKGLTHSSWSEEALMILLRLITDANPN